jgi:hypothetical protein
MEELKNDQNPYEEIYSVPATASLWVLLPKVAGGIVFSTVLLIGLFWLQFGEINSFAWLMAIIAAGFQILLVIGLRQKDRLNDGPVVKPNKTLDMIGAFWLIAVIFGAVIGWFTGSLAESIPSAAIPFHIATVVLTIVLPFLTSLPNYRYVNGSRAIIMLPMLLILTALPMLLGIDSARALWAAITQ